MPDSSESLERLTRNPLSRRVSRNQFRMLLFKSFKFREKPVIFPVRNPRLTENIIKMIMFPNQLAQPLNFLVHIFTHKTLIIFIDSKIEIEFLSCNELVGIIST